MFVGIAFFSLASLSYLFVTPRLLILVRFLQGLSAAPLSIMSAALIAEYFAEERGKGIRNLQPAKGCRVCPGSDHCRRHRMEIKLRSDLSGVVRGRGTGVSFVIASP